LFTTYLELFSPVIKKTFTPFVVPLRESIMGSMADKGAGSAVEAMTVSVTDKTTPAAWHGIIEIHTRGDSNKTDSRESLSPIGAGRA